MAAVQEWLCPMSPVQHRADPTLPPLESPADPALITSTLGHSWHMISAFLWTSSPHKVGMWSNWVSLCCLGPRCVPSLPLHCASSLCCFIKIQPAVVNPRPWRWVLVGFFKGLWYIFVRIYAISSFIPSPSFLRMPSSPGDLLLFSAFCFLLENLYLIFMPVIIQGEKGDALEAQSENKTARFSAVTLFERCFCVLAGYLLPSSLTFPSLLGVILEKSEGLKPAAPPAWVHEDSCNNKLGVRARKVHL